ncbi:MAG: LemA family protein [Clostridiales bacterium]|nr:LemA family protein [Clostridiales bacterium]
MDILKKNSIAAFAMVMMILAGTLIGSHNSLVSLRDKAAGVFVIGARGDGIGIQGDLRERDNAAYNMVVIARKYLPEDNALIQNVLNARKALDSASSVRQKAAADRELAIAVKDLYDVLSGMALSDQDARYPQRLYTDFYSRGETISHDPYNQTAAEFNRILAGFPAGVLGGLTGIQPLELFQ